ncbi:MAG: hypothetical protein HRU26_00895 [Psychroserpens sp.]|nr:hypothetical protein [Psychroserpens sp.]
MITHIRNFLKPKNLLKQQPTDDKTDSYKGITVWGIDYSYENGKSGRYYNYNNNDFPQQLIQDVYNSPVAASCLELWVEYIVGRGFGDEINSMVINPEGETMLDLLRKVAYDVAHLEGFSVHQSYNAGLEVTASHHQPFEQSRLGEIKGGVVQDIKTNPYFGIYDQYENRYTKTFYTWNGNPEFIKTQMMNHAKKKLEGQVKYDYPGQMYWASIEKPLARIYPQPFYYSAVNWLRIDAEIQKFHERNIKNNLIQSHIINVYGDPDELVGKDDDNGDQGYTLGERFNQMLEEGARGAENGGSQWINWYTAEEGKIEPTVFPTNANDQLFQTLQDLTTQSITVGCKTPGILIGVHKEGKLGNTQEIINSIKIMQSNVKPKQQFIVSHFKKLFPEVGIETIYDNNVIDILPEWVFTTDVLTNDEKRKYLMNNFNIELSNIEDIMPNENTND